MTRHYTRTCILCDTLIPSKYRLCSEHFIKYKNVMNERWFIVLAESQKTQDEINRRESYSLPYSQSTDLHGTYKSSELLSKRNIGRPETNWIIVNKVLEIYDMSIEDFLLNKVPRVKSLRTIAKELNNVIDHCTVRNIIRAYRIIQVL